MFGIDIEQIGQIAIQAGEEILEVYSSEDFGVETKGDNSPLTKADKASHKVIAKALAALDVKFPILSEEGKEEDLESRKNWETFWCVDPLDGTKEFIKRNGEFTVNIALIHQKYPVLGVIYVPVTGILYFADENGAFRRTAEGSNEKMQVAGVGSKKPIALGSRSHASEIETKILEMFGVGEVVGKGSSLKFCVVAEGKANIYFRKNPTMEWDTAAGQAIVEQAGGAVLNKQNERFYYNKESLVNDSFLCLGYKKTDLKWNDF